MAYLSLSFETRLAVVCLTGTDWHSQSFETWLIVVCLTGIDCGTPTRLPGSLPYLLTSTAYSAQFTFSCRTPLFTRVGKSVITNSEVVTCGANDVWDFGDLRCEGV